MHPGNYDMSRGLKNEQVLKTADVWARVLQAKEVARVKMRGLCLWPVSPWLQLEY